MALSIFQKNLKKIDDLMKILKDFPSMKNLDLASEVSTKKIYLWKNNKKENIDFENFKENFIAVYDFGIKKNILNILNNSKYKVIVFPYNYCAKKNN